METVIMFEGDEPREVERQNVQAAIDSGLEPAAEFFTPDNEKHVVRQRDYDAAFSKGLKPANMQEQTFWESFKQGAKRGWDVFSSSETGERPERTSLEQSQAWDSNPISYGVGVAAGLAPAVLGGAAAIGGAGMAARKGMQKADPYIKPSAMAAKQAYQDTMKSTDIPDVMGITRPLAAGAAAVAGAFKQVPDTRREMVDLAKLDLKETSREAGTVGAIGNRLYLGQEILDAGASPAKKAIAERAATMAPSNLRTDHLSKAFEMGTTRRHTARNFLPEVAAENITPDLKQTFKYLQKGKGEAYEKLHGQAQQEYQAESGVHIPGKLVSRLDMLKGVQEVTTDAPEGAQARAIKGITGPTVATLEAAKQIVSDGPAPYGLVPGGFNEADPKEQYKRLKVAREFLGSQIKQMKGSKDPNISNRASLKQLEEAKAEFDDVMKSIPSQARADELYAQSMKAKEAFYDAMEFGKGMKKKIDIPTVKKLFGNNDKAYRLQEGIDTMRQFLNKYGDDIVPEKRAEMESVVNRFDVLRGQAEDKRLLEGLRQAQGPSSPALERTKALNEAKGLPNDLFNAPAGAMNAADEFIARRSSQFFGKPFEGLKQEQKNTLIRLLMWRQQNPNATMSDEESMFKKTLKKGGK